MKAGVGGKEAKKIEKKRDSYMFLSFDPLVSSLNSFQILKMQLHQSINLHRENNKSKRKEGDTNGIRGCKGTGMQGRRYRRANINTLINAFNNE